MRPFFRISRVLCLLALLVSLSAGAQVMDRVVAVVNRDVVTQSELAARVQAISRQLKRQGTALPPAAQLRSQVLERMIMERLQLQAAESVGIRIDEMMLDRAVSRIAEDNKLTLGDFKKAVSNEGWTWEDFRENIRNEISLAQLREREVDSRIVVTNAEIERMLGEQGTSALN